MHFEFWRSVSMFSLVPIFLYVSWLMGGACLLQPSRPVMNCFPSVKAFFFWFVFAAVTVSMCSAELSRLWPSLSYILIGIGDGVLLLYAMQCLVSGRNTKPDPSPGQSHSVMREYKSPLECD